MTELRDYAQIDHGNRPFRKLLSLICTLSFHNTYAADSEQITAASANKFTVTFLGRS